MSFLSSIIPDKALIQHLIQYLQETAASITTQTLTIYQKELGGDKTAGHNTAVIPASTVYVEHVGLGFETSAAHIFPKSNLVISATSAITSTRIRLEHDLVYDFSEPIKPRKRQPTPPEPKKQGKWTVPVNNNIGMTNELLFRLMDDSDRGLVIFSIHVGVNMSYLPWCKVVSSPELGHKSGSNWTLKRNNRHGVFGEGPTNPETIGYIDRDQKNLASGHKVSAVVRRRCHVPEDPPIPSMEQGTHYYIYTLHFAIEEPFASEPGSPQATAGVSPSTPSGSPTILRAEMMDLAGTGSFSLEC